MASVLRRTSLIVAGLFLLLPHVVYAFLWWGPGHLTIGNDYPVYQARQQLIFMQAVRDGTFPLWLPGELGGVPFADYLFAGQYWPVTWVMLTVDAVFNGFQLEILTHVHLFFLSMAGFFTYLVARRLGVSALPALVAGIVFLFNFRMLDAFRYAMALDVVVWLPVAIYLIERITARPRMRFALLYAIVQYMLLTPGHMQEAFYCIGFANVYLVARLLMLKSCAADRDRWKWFGARFSCLFGGQLLGLALCAVMLWPIIEDVLPLWTRRMSGDPSFVSQYHLPGVGLVFNLFYPWLAGVASAFYGSQFTWIAMALAIGLVLLKRDGWDVRQRRMVFFLAGVFAFCVLCSLGPETPVARTVGAVVPLFDSFRCPGRIMTVGMFAAAVLSAFGVHQVLSAGPSRRVAERILVVGYAVFALAGLGLAGLLLDDRIGLYERAAYIPFLGNASTVSPAGIHRDAEHMVPMMAAVIVGVACISLTFVFLWRRTRLGRTMLVVSLLVVSLIEVAIYHSRGTWLLEGPVASARSDRFKDADVYHTRTSHELGDYSHCLPVPPIPKAEGKIHVAVSGRLAELLVHGGAPAWQIFHQTDPERPIPRAYVTPTVQLVRGDDPSAIARMNPYETSVIDVDAPDNTPAQHDSNLAQLATSEAQVTPEEAFARFKELNAHINVKEYTFNRAAFETQTTVHGLFNYSDSYARGWRATLDGEDIPVYRANHAFKAVMLPAGSHRIEFVYDPSSFRLGLVVSLGSMCVLVGCIASCFGRFARRRIALGLVIGAIALVPAGLLYGAVYERIGQPGLINYAPRPHTPVKDGDDSPEVSLPARSVAPETPERGPARA